LNPVLAAQSRNARISSDERASSARPEVKIGLNVPASLTNARPSMRSRPWIDPGWNDRPSGREGLNVSAGPTLVAAALSTPGPPLSADT